MQLADRVALITGGGEGIGRATALLFAREGAKVAVLGRHRENLDPVVDLIAAESGQAMAVCADVSKPDEMQAAIKEVVDKWGRLDIVFANAGINGVWAPLEELELAAHDGRLARMSGFGPRRSTGLTIPRSSGHSVREALRDARPPGASMIRRFPNSAASSMSRSSICASAIFCWSWRIS